MSERDVLKLFSAHKAHKAEMELLLRCAKQSADARKDLLARRIAFVDCWVACAPAKGRFVLQRHLIEGVSWARLSEESQAAGIGPSDVRALQRLQERTIKQICAFVQARLGEDLDGLCVGAGENTEGLTVETPRV